MLLRACGALPVVLPSLAAALESWDDARRRGFFAHLAALDRLVRSGEDTASLRDQLGRFVARLHEAGIYFRSLHLGNIVLTPAGELGLIDIADLRASGNPIPRHRRLRNLKHLMRDEQDRAWICHPDATVFDRAYNIALGQGAADRA